MPLQLPESEVLNMNFLKKLRPSSRESSLFIILIVAVGGTGLINPRFLTGDGTRDLLTSTSVVALLAIGIAPIVVMRHIDLSIASTVGLSAWTVADFCAKNPSFTWVQCFVIGSIIGLAVGILNGLLPCGMIYVALTSALATQNILQGGLIMTFFGIGTMPALIMVAIGGQYLGRTVRTKLQSLLPVFIFSMGILLILRGLHLGIPYLSPQIGFGTAAVPCHK